MHIRVSAFLAPFKDFLFPPLCFSCNNRLSETESRVCAACWASIEEVQAGDSTIVTLRERFAADGWIDELCAGFYFEQGGVFQKLAHSLKYEGVLTFGLEFGVRLGRILEREAYVGEIDAIMPVPLHAVRLRERGYNQSQVICQGIASLTKTPILTSVVHRRKNTVSQTYLSSEERRLNVGDAFEIGDPEKVEGKVILLVDDVITTGSTVQAVARVLKKGGAKKVLVASAALAKLA